MQVYPDAEDPYTYLYALVEIGEELNELKVRYIGQTNSPTRRFKEYVLTPGTIPKVKWVGGLLNEGKEPRMAIFDKVRKDIANVRERAAIYAFSLTENYWDDTLEGFPNWQEALLNAKY